MGDGFETTDMKSRDRVAKWWTLREDGRIRCDLCPRACTLRDGQRGFCYTRMAQGQKMVLDTYGRCSGLGLDPIEKNRCTIFCQVLRCCLSERQDVT